MIIVAMLMIRMCCRGQCWVAATEQDGVIPSVAAISPARGFVNLHLGLLLALTLCSFYNSTARYPSLLPSGRKLGQFLKQIHVGWKCKLMIWSFNHSGANPDAEEFPADSGSSDFTNPRQELELKPLLLLVSCPLPCICLC